MLLASAVSLGGSLGVDALLVAAGEALFPSTKGFAHFRFSDYGVLTLIGVAIACAAWPVVTRLSWAPRWLFFRLAILVTLVLWLPDVWILLRGEPPRAVGVLIAMHLAIALVTYNALVRLAPAAPQAVAGTGGRAASGVPGGERTALVVGRNAWVAMVVLVGVELALGVAALLVVPFSRGDAVVPSRGEALYLVHALAGAALGVGAVVLAVAASRGPRLQWWSAVIGLGALVVAAAGGVLAVYHSLRLLGAGLMMLGGLVAGAAYFLPVFESLPPPAAPSADVAAPGTGAAAGHGDRRRM